MRSAVAPALGAAWAMVVVLAIAPLRLPRNRVDRLIVRAPRPAPSPRRALERLGDLVVTRICRRPPASPLVHTRIGGLLTAAVAGLVVWPPLGAVLAVVAWAGPQARRQAAERRRRARLEADLADVVDLFGVAVAAGLTVPLALGAVAGRASGPIGPELRKVVDQVGMGQRVSEALETMVVCAGEPVRPLVAALTDCDRYGTPLGATLDRLAADVRRATRVRAEDAARKVPVKLLFPLVLCILPAFALLTVAPLIASAVRSLRL